MARARWRTALIVALSSCTPCSSEWILINLIRHGERDNNVSNPHLAKAGYERAAYIARCVATAHHTLAFPLGKPTRLMASLRQASSAKGISQKESVRPLETLTPLSQKLSIPIDNHVNMEDVDSFVRYVQGMRAGETLLVAWQHWFLTFMVEALGFEGLIPTSYPRSCNYSQWTEPAYAMDKEEGDCYDVIWQLVLFRENPTQRWRTDAFTSLHQGFGGRDSPCASAFYPDSTPAHWGSMSAAAASTYHSPWPLPRGVKSTRDATDAAELRESTAGAAAVVMPSLEDPASRDRANPLHDLSLVGAGLALSALVAFSRAMWRARVANEDSLAVGTLGEDSSTEYQAV